MVSVAVRKYQVAVPWFHVCEEVSGNCAMVAVSVRKYQVAVPWLQCL